MGVYLLDSIARGGTAAKNEAAMKRPRNRQSSSVSQEEFALNTPDEKSGQAFEFGSTSNLVKRKRAASI